MQYNSSEHAVESIHLRTAGSYMVMLISDASWGRLSQLHITEKPGIQAVRKITASAQIMVSKTQTCMLAECIAGVFSV